MAGSSSYKQQAAIALLVKQHTTFWIALAKADNPWPDDNVPPEATPAEEVDTPIIYMRVMQPKLCKLVAQDEDFVHAGEEYQYVDDGNAIAEWARFIHCTGQFDGDVHPTGLHRQTALFADLEPIPGKEGADWLLPADVTDPGRLMYHDNHQPRSLTPGETRDADIVYEIR